MSSDIADAARSALGGSSAASTLRRVSDGRADAATENDPVDELDGVPVLPDEDGAREGAWLPVVASAPAGVAGSADPTGLALSGPRPLQTVAVAAGGFVAGVAVVGLVQRRRHRRALAAGRPRPGRGASAGPIGELVQIVGSRSVLVDVHLLGGRD